jgi:hypothetical protein
MAVAERKAAPEAARLAKAAKPKPKGQPKAAQARAPAPVPPAVRKAAAKVPRDVDMEGDPSRAPPPRSAARRSFCKSQ